MSIGNLDSEPVVLCFGGSVGLWSLGPRQAVKIYRQVVSIYGSKNSIFVTTSRRTDPRIAPVLRNTLRPTDMLYEWGRKEPNPYSDLIRTCSEFVVTGDSVSMLIELLRLGKSVRIADISTPISRALDVLRAKAPFLFGPRDLTSLHLELTRTGAVCFLGQKSRPRVKLLEDETSKVVSAIQSLIHTGA